MAVCVVEIHIFFVSNSRLFHTSLSLIRRFVILGYMSLPIWSSSSSFKNVLKSLHLFRVNISTYSKYII
jgi:hypothetical protein